MRIPKEIYDFKAFGQAIKNARQDKGWTREKLAEIMDLAPRYILSIENNGQHPSLQVFYELVKLFDISVDQFFFPNATPVKSTCRRQLDSLLDEVNEKDLVIVTATVKGIKEVKEIGE